MKETMMRTLAIAIFLFPCAAQGAEPGIEGVHMLMPEADAVATLTVIAAERGRGIGRESFRGECGYTTHQVQAAGWPFTIRVRDGRVYRIDRYYTHDEERKIGTDDALKAFIAKAKRKYGKLRNTKPHHFHGRVSGYTYTFRKAAYEYQLHVSLGMFHNSLKSIIVTHSPTQTTIDQCHARQRRAQDVANASSLDLP